MDKTTDPNAYFKANLKCPVYLIRVFGCIAMSADIKTNIYQNQTTIPGRDITLLMHYIAPMNRLKCNYPNDDVTHST